MKLTRTRLKEIIRDEIKKINENSETGLMVYPSTSQDKFKIDKWLETADWFGGWDREGYFFFPENQSMYDELEKELEKEFYKLKINARFEGI